VKNAPAVTARRATNQIVLAADHQALAATAVVSLPAAAAETLAVIVLVVIVLAEQTVRVVTMRLIDLVVTATGHTRPVPPETAIGLIRCARLVTAMPDHAVMAHRLIDLVVTAQPGHLALLEIAPIRLDRLATVIRVLVGTATTAPVFPAPTAIPVRPEPVAVIAPTVLVRVVTATRAHVARATALVGHRVRRPIDRILRARRVTVRAQTGVVQIVPARIVRIVPAQIVRVPIGHMAISHVVSGSPMEASVVRSVRR
jgi:hypothetical protein